MVAVDTHVLEDAAQAACRAALRAGLADADARDLAQDALVRALTSAQPPGGVPLAAWVYGIARNLGRDHVKSARSREVAITDAPESIDSQDPATILAVRRAVQDLPENLRDVVTLHELEELSLRETADALAIPFDTAKDRLRRAREQLRAQLGDTDYKTERTHTRKRAAGAGAVVAIAVLAKLGERTASAATRTWAALAIGAALAVGGFAIGRVTAKPEERAPVTIAWSPVITQAPAPITTPAPKPQPAPAIAPVQHAHVTPPTSPQPERAAERLLIDRARAALQRGLADEALVSLMSAERQFPSGTLAEERDVLIIEAYVSQGNADVARRRIDRYRADHPNGALHSRVDAAAAAL
ncbi:MAG: sigma-70 family RNA polymerase sigma factor [Kofleriaceae bacterium]